MRGGGRREALTGRLFSIQPASSAGFLPGKVGIPPPPNGEQALRQSGCSSALRLLRLRPGRGSPPPTTPGAGTHHRWRGRRRGRTQPACVVRRGSTGGSSRRRPTGGPRPGRAAGRAWKGDRTRRPEQRHQPRTAVPSAGSPEPSGCKRQEEGRSSVEGRVLVRFW